MQVHPRWRPAPARRLPSELLAKRRLTGFRGTSGMSNRVEQVTDPTAMVRHGIGADPVRREDARFLMGRGTYLDDLQIPDALHAVVVRSTHAHAGIGALRVDAARRAPGVAAVLTGADATLDGLQPLRPTAEANVKTGERFTFAPQPLLAQHKVRYVGEPVALVIAGTLEQALDAAEMVDIDYAPLPAVTTPAAARAAGAPLIADGVPANTCFEWRVGDTAGVEAALAGAAHRVTIKVDNHRIVTSPMEPRGVVALYDPVEGRHVLHVSSQNVHGIRDQVARSLGVAPTSVRLVAPDVGGNFGAKNFIYPEYVLSAWAARRIGRPVKWIATRTEIFLGDHQSRDHLAEATLALDASGRFLALRIDCVANAGAYLVSAGGVMTYQYIHLPGTVYRIPAIDLGIACVLTNTTPVGVTRGPGFAEMVNIVERLVDAAARECGFDRAELRRANLWPAAGMPMTNSFGQIVDSGAFPVTFERALDVADVAGFAARRAASADRGCLRGLGFAYHIKGTGGSPHENARIAFEADGTLTVTSGTHSVGQGHATTFPQIVADRLGVPNELVRFRQADTDLLPLGGGSGSSRSTFMGGTAIWRAAEEVVAKGCVHAARLLGVADADVRFEDGHFVARGSNLSISLLEVAAHARGTARPLDAYHSWTRDLLTFPNGAHIVEVEIDRETGKLAVVRYTAVDDYGVLVNPRIAAGQVHGAIAQGLGQAVLEGTVYQAESGQPMTASFMDYALPRADDMPRIALEFNATRCTTNPLGVKGCGEAGAIGAYPAIANAIADALAEFGAPMLDGPATPERLWRAMRQR